MFNLQAIPSSGPGCTQPVTSALNVTHGFLVKQMDRLETPANQIEALRTLAQWSLAEYSASERRLAQGAGGTFSMGSILPGTNAPPIVRSTLNAIQAEITPAITTGLTDPQQRVEYQRRFSLWIHQEYQRLEMEIGASGRIAAA